MAVCKSLVKRDLQAEFAAVVLPKLDLLGQFFAFDGLVWGPIHDKHSLPLRARYVKHPHTAFGWKVCLYSAHVSFLAGVGHACARIDCQ